jgi:hypothetical protein
VGAWAPFKLASIANADPVNGYPALDHGTYRGRVEIRDLAAPRARVMVPVRLVLGGGERTPTIATRPRSISLRLAPGQRRRVNLVLSDASRLCGYAYSLQTTRPWVRVNPFLMAGRVGARPARSAPAARDTGQGNGFEPLSIRARGLAPGVYHASVIVQSENAVHNPTWVRITLRVGASPRHRARQAGGGPGFTG